MKAYAKKHWHGGPSGNHPNLWAAKPIDVLASGMHLEHILRHLGPEFRMIDLIAAIFGKFESDVGSPANESWNVETAKRLAVVLRSLECEQLDSRTAPDDNGHRTTTSRWGNPFAASQS